nr:4Fe-4S binding protein [Desulfobulbaceae bacterium]
MKRRRLAPLRRLGQSLFLCLFLFLFIKTDYQGSDNLQYAVNLIFRIDPLVAAATMLAAKTFIILLFPALFTIVFTFLLGRFFCGWVCPMGTIIDMSHKLARPAPNTTDWKHQNLRYYILFFVLTGALFGLPLVGYVDPFSILVRALTLALYPAFNFSSESFFTFTYLNAPPWVNSVTEPLYAFMKNYILASDPRVYTLTLLSLSILLIVLLLETVERRFFCRNLCPLGAMFSLVARFSLLRTIGGENSRCGKCQNCRSTCRMAAIDHNKAVSMEKCIFCLDCIDACPKKQISFGFAFKLAPISMNISRRGFITTAISSAAIPLFLPGRAISKRPNPKLLRPPGALSEQDFLTRCVRCGECMKVCIGNGLHPLFLEAGLEGIFSPKLSPRLGYCEYNCTLCGQVCPTGAIQKLSPEIKKKERIGLATFDKNRCLPYAKAIPCIVCEEHCPIADKAIKFKEVELVNDNGQRLVMKQPYAIDELCIGCGICEYKCPLEGEAAVSISRPDNSRLQKDALSY